MNELNNRFIEFYEALVLQKTVKSAKHLAEILEVSSSLISEIVKGRCIIGTKVIQNSVIKLNLNPYWFFTGVGPIYNDGSVTEINHQDEKKEVYADSAAFTSLINEIKQLSGTNALQEKEIKELKDILKSKYGYSDLSIAAEPVVKYTKK